MIAQVAETNDTAMTAQASTSSAQPTDAGWQAALRAAIRDVDELLAAVEVDPQDVETAAPVDRDFPLLVPRGFVARMRKGDPRDPLLRQVLPLKHEVDDVAGFGHDPLDEQAVSRGGVLRKYPGRALFIATASCPVHCRYCFRRHFPYPRQVASKDGWREAVAAVANDSSISEVILSGGDPLSLSNRRLAELIGSLDPIGHVDTLRIHSRYPIVLPERIDSELLALLSTTRLRTVLVIHCNHAREIDAAVVAALRAAQRSGVLTLNQSVLLEGVNDSVDALEALSRALFRAGTLPYYLHELDRVAGAAHFEVTHERALELIDAVRKRLPGYLVPRLVREIPGASSKIILA